MSRDKYVPNCEVHQTPTVEHASVNFVVYRSTANAPALLNHRQGTIDKGPEALHDGSGESNQSTTSNVGNYKMPPLPLDPYTHCVPGCLPAIARGIHVGQIIRRRRHKRQDPTLTA
jgi:hypothetical protein